MPTVIIMDAAGLALGAAAGCLFKKHISAQLKESINLALAVISAGIGVQLLVQAVHMAAAVLALLTGGLIGHALGIDRRLAALSGRLPGTKGGNAAASSQVSDPAQVVLMAFTLCCISTTGIIGALNLGFQGDPTVLTTKAIMDCVTAVFFAAESGFVLAVVSIPLCAILMAFYGLSGILMPHLTPEMIGDFAACGGMIQLLNGMRIAKLKNPPVADFMPALVLVFFFSMAWAKLL